MVCFKSVVRVAGALILLTCFSSGRPASAEDGFPFGMEMTLDAIHQPGSKRVPDLDIGENGEVILELWCKGGKGQFSLAGNTVIFVAGPMAAIFKCSNRFLVRRNERSRAQTASAPFTLVRISQS